MKRLISKFLNREVLISELSSDEPWIGTILGIFQEGGEWFYDVRSDSRRFALTVRSVNWIEETAKGKRLRKKLKHKRRMGKVLRLIKP